MAAKPRIKAGTSKSAEPKKAHGRPSPFTAALARTICERLAKGETLRAVCRDEGMPAESTVRLWALDDVGGFSAQYARAREIGYHGMADEMVEIADETRLDTIEGEEGAEDRPDNEWITRSRLRVDTRKWLLSKALPKIYGDKLDVEHHMESLTLKVEMARPVKR